MRYVRSLILGAILLCGCHEMAPQPPEITPEASFYIYQAPEINPAAMSKADVAKLFDTINAVTERGREIIESAASWQDAHHELVNLFQAHPEDAVSPARQVLAARMLEQRLLPAPASEARQQAIAFYTTILLKAENPDASILLPALAQLKDHWPEAQREEAIRATRERARAYLERNKDLLARVEDCATCRVQKQAAFKAPESADEARTLRLARIDAALAGS